MYRAAIESILGFKIQHNVMTINPCIPKEWDNFEIKYRKHKMLFTISILNNQNENSIEVDQILVEGNEIHMNGDGLEHKVVVKLKQT
jgi:cellobiose phosphorylase